MKKGGFSAALLFWLSYFPVIARLDRAIQYSREAAA
jgi:hypothetical protein